MSQPLPLQDQVAIVTGAGRGIGRAIALAFAQAGAAVACAARTADDLNSLVAEIQQSGGTAFALPTDVTQRPAVDDLVDQTIATYGGLDILVINAGGNFDRRPIETSVADEWQATFDLNLNSAYHCAQAALPHLKQRGGGKIIVLGSGLGHHGRANMAAYSCSKAALWMFTRVLAQEVWGFGISVNELIPGPVDTSLARQSARQTDSVFNIDSEWIKGPEDVVPLALFMATQPALGPTAQSFSLMRRDG